MSCSSDSCNGRGICFTIGNLYQFYNYENNDNTYTPWERDAMTGCVCDNGFTGASCEIRK